MRIHDRRRRVTNLTELCWNSFRRDLMTENGYAEGRSDYDCLRAYCKCMDRLPSALVAL